MRRLDRLSHAAMWACFLAGMLLVAYGTMMGSVTGTYAALGIAGVPGSTLFSTLWVPASLALAAYDDSRQHRQTMLYYSLAAVAGLWTATAVASLIVHVA
jgi:hypothetical protein